MQIEKVEGSVKLHMTCGEIIPLSEDDIMEMVTELVTLRKTLKSFIGDNCVKISDEKRDAIICELLGVA